jgi:hypothetical protein
LRIRLNAEINAAMTPPNIPALAAPPGPPDWPHKGHTDNGPNRANKPNHQAAKRAIGRNQPTRPQKKGRLMSSPMVLP